MLNKSPLGTLCCLPLEVREIIYNYLTPPSRLPTILRSRHLGVSSVSHRPPPLALLLTCQQLSAEALAVHYRKCVFKFDGLLDPANIWPLWQIEEVLGASDAGRATLKNMRKVELNLFWHRLPDGGVANAVRQYAGVCENEVEKRVERLGRAVQVLKRATQLRAVVLTWKEIPAREGEEQPCWTLKERVLRTLGASRGPKIVAGDLIASAEVEEGIMALIAELNKPTRHSDDGEPVQATAHREYYDLVEFERASMKISNSFNKSISYFG